MPETIQQKYKRLAEQKIKQLDKMYEEYRTKIGKMAEVPPSQRDDFNLCSARYIRKALKYTPENTDKKEEYISDMLNTCTICAGKEREISKSKRSMNGWICYAKTKSKELGRKYMEIISDKNLKSQEYEPKKSYWKEQAIEGCPLGA